MLISINNAISTFRTWTTSLQSTVLCSNLKVDASPHTPGRQLSDSDLKSCYVFVDNPNFWVSGKKEDGKRLVDTDTDPRFRVELDKLLQGVTGGRQISEAFLYGRISQTIKAKAEENGFKVKNYSRFAPNVAMARDILLSLHSLSFVENKEKVVFIVVTGDSKFRRTSAGRNSPSGSTSGIMVLERCHVTRVPSTRSHL
jgi:hypothetical protein